MPAMAAGCCVCLGCDMVAGVGVVVGLELGAIGGEEGGSEIGEMGEMREKEEGRRALISDDRMVGGAGGCARRVRSVQVVE